MFERGPIRGASAAREKCAAKDDFGARNGLQPVTRSQIVLRGALFPSGACAPNWTAFEHRSCDCPAVFCNPTTRAWWTGKDSNLRSPQGAADLQSAGFSHSPTRPVKTFGTRSTSPELILQQLASTPRKNTKRTRVKRHQPVRFSCQDSLRPRSPET